VATGDHLSCASRLAIDVRETAAATHALLEGRADPAADYSALARELLPDWYEDWVLMERERLRQLHLHALELLCQTLSQAGQHTQAIQAGLAGVRGEPLRESAQRVLIEAHLREGNRSEALRQYATFRKLLRAELDLEPSPALRAIVEELRTK
jgi:DNA-binding SARP family transcriptional activator